MQRGDFNPVLVYGFVADIRLYRNDFSKNGVIYNFNVCINHEPGCPVYCAIVINETDYEKAYSLRNQYIDENNDKIKLLNDVVEEINAKYNKEYKCKWQLAIDGWPECYEFEMEDYHDNLLLNNPTQYNTNDNIKKEEPPIKLYDGKELEIEEYDD